MLVLLLLHLQTSFVYRTFLAVNADMITGFYQCLVKSTFFSPFIACQTVLREAVKFDDPRHGLQSHAAFDGYLEDYRSLRETRDGKWHERDEIIK